MKRLKKPEAVVWIGLALCFADIRASGLCLGPGTDRFCEGWRADFYSKRERLMVALPSSQLFPLEAPGKHVVADHLEADGADDEGDSPDDERDRRRARDAEQEGNEHAADHHDGGKRERNPRYVHRLAPGIGNGRQHGRQHPLVELARLVDGQVDEQE